MGASGKPFSEGNVPDKTQNLTIIPRSHLRCADPAFGLYPCNFSSKERFVATSCYFPVGN